MSYFSVRSNADLQVLARYFIEDFSHFQQQMNAFEEYWVIVPSASVQAWLTTQITQQLGIGAGIRFLQPAQALWHFQRQLNADLPEISPFSKASMALRLYVFFSDLLKKEAGGELIEKDFQPLMHYLHQQPSDNARILLASRIADVFDAYLMYRPDWIAVWEDDKLALSEKDRQLLEQHRWQARLWKTIVAGAGTAVHRAELAHMLEQHIARNDELYYPRRMAVFGVSTLEPQVLKQLGLLSGLIEISLYWQNPCADFWADTLPPKSKGALVEQLGGENAWLSGNSLLAAWGQYARGFYAQLVDAGLLDFDDYGLWEKFRQPSGSTLHLVQQSINHNAGLLANSVSSDGSITLAAHWSRKREVDGLHDFLLSQFQRAEEEGTPLLPHELVVMLPDVDAYAPYIEAVFDAQPEGRRIPYQLCGASVTHQQLLGAIHVFLNLPKGRYPISELLDLLHLSFVRKTFNITGKDDDKLQAWIQASGIHWGLDEQTWVQQGLPPHRDNTLAGGIDRLLMGLALDDEVFARFDNDNLLDAQYGVAGVSPLNAQLIGQLAAFVDVLTQWRDFSAREHLVHEWVDAAIAAVDSTFTADRDHLAELAAFKQSLASLVEQGISAGVVAPLNIDVFLKMLEPMLDAGKNTAHFQWGKITIGSFSATRGIPYRVTAILGMNDADFPATPESDDIDLLPYSYRLGDRTPTAADRYAFLQALMSSRDAFYCSYVSRDICNGAIHNPSLLLVELLEFIGGDEAQWITQHPLQPFSDEYFTGHSGLSSYAAQWQRFQVAVNQEISTGKTLEWKMPPVLHINDLRYFIENPADAFFRTVFNTTFNSPGHSINDDEPFEIDKLLEWDIKQALVWQNASDASAVTSFNTQDDDHVFLKWQARGLLPMGFGEGNSSQRLLESIKGVRNHLMPLLSGCKKVSQMIDVKLHSGVRLLGEIGLYYKPEENRYFSILAMHKPASGIKAKYRMRAMFNHMVLRELVIAGQLPAHKVCVVCEDNAYVFLESGQHHVNVLDEWVELYRQAMTRPVPLNAPLMDALAKELEGEDTSLLNVDTLTVAFHVALGKIADYEKSIAILRLMDDPATHFNVLPYLDAFAVPAIESKGNATWSALYE